MKRITEWIDCIRPTPNWLGNPLTGLGGRICDERKRRNSLQTNKKGLKIASCNQSNVRRSKRARCSTKCPAQSSRWAHVFVFFFSFLIRSYSDSGWKSATDHREGDAHRVQVPRRVGVVRAADLLEGHAVVPRGESTVSHSNKKKYSKKNTHTHTHTHRMSEVSLLVGPSVGRNRALIDGSSGAGLDRLGHGGHY